MYNPFKFCRVSFIIYTAIILVIISALFFIKDPVNIRRRYTTYIRRQSSVTHDKQLLESENEQQKVSQYPYKNDDTMEHKHEANLNVAQNLIKKINILCWVMTTPENHQQKAFHVKRTWGSRCNTLLFFSSTNDMSLPSIGLNSTKVGRDYLWAKTKEAFKFVYENYLNEADFFMKADDDTYVVVENLRLLLKDYDPMYPIYFGCRFKPYVTQGYMSGGAGYVLSRGALIAFIERAVDDPSKCRAEHDGNEDVEMGKCLQNVGVEAGDSRDALGRHRFLPMIPEQHLIAGYIPPSSWYWKYIYYPQADGLECCSDTAISFHYVSPNQMYVLDYFIYRLRPFGRKENNETLALNNISSANKLMINNNSLPNKLFPGANQTTTGFSYNNDSLAKLTNVKGGSSVSINK